MPESLIDIWRRIIIGETKSWVLFRHGTCVILVQPEAELAAQALRLMEEYGPVHAGSPAGDFSTVKLTNDPGWVVTCHHPDILTYVAPGEVNNRATNDLTLGLLGK